MNFTKYLSISSSKNIIKVPYHETIKLFSKFFFPPISFLKIFFDQFSQKIPTTYEGLFGMVRTRRTLCEASGVVQGEVFRRSRNKTIEWFGSIGETFAQKFCYSEKVPYLIKSICN